MLLATWNVNSLKARLPRVLEFLELHAPDVLCLQETKVDPDRPSRTPSSPRRATRPSTTRAGAGRAWRSLAPRRLRAEDARAGLEGEPAADEARWIEATVGALRGSRASTSRTAADRLARVYADKLRFLDAVAERIAPSRAASVVAGDFNVCPSDLDVYDPAAFVGSTHVTPARARALPRDCCEAGTVDAFRAPAPDEPGFTWWDYRAGHFHKKLGLRIDAVLLSPRSPSGCESCGIDRNFRKGNRSRPTTRRCWRASRRARAGRGSGASWRGAMSPCGLRAQPRDALVVEAAPSDSLCADHVAGGDAVALLQPAGQAQRRSQLPAVAHELGVACARRARCRSRRG